MPAKKDPAAMFAKLAGKALSDETTAEASDEPGLKVESPSDKAPSTENSFLQDEKKLENETIQLETPSAPELRVNVTRARTSGKKGRPPGKRSDPNYTQIGAYIPRDLDKAVKRLLVDEDEMDLSKLVAILLEDWVKQKSS